MENSCQIEVVGSESDKREDPQRIKQNIQSFVYASKGHTGMSTIIEESASLERSKSKRVSDSVTWPPTRMEPIVEMNSQLFDTEDLTNPISQTASVLTGNRMKSSQIEQQRHESGTIDGDEDYVSESLLRVDKNNHVYVQKVFDGQFSDQESLDLNRISSLPRPRQALREDLSENAVFSDAFTVKESYGEQ